MSDTVKRITLALSKEDLRILNSLKEHFGESQSVVIKRALVKLYDGRISYEFVPIPKPS